MFTSKGLFSNLIVGTPPLPSKMLPEIEIKIFSIWEKGKKRVDICNQLKEALPGKI